MAALRLALALVVLGAAGSLVAPGALAQPGNPFSPGLPPQTGTATTPSTPAPSTPTTNTTSSSSGDNGLGGGGLVAIAIGALVVLGGICFFIWRDARRRAPVRTRTAAPVGRAPGRSGTRQRVKSRKLSQAERRRRKRGRAR